MMMENNINLYFLCGLPHSGSCVLSSILNQHSKIHVETNSDLFSITGVTHAKWKEINNSNDTKKHYNIINGIIKNTFKDATKPIIIDKCRGWLHPESLSVIQEVLNKPVKIIATVRNPYDCVASLLMDIKPDDIESFLVFSPVILSLRNYFALMAQLQEKSPENICFIDYDDLIQSPQKQMDIVADFLEVDRFVYNTNNIGANIIGESEERLWGTNIVHNISQRLSKQHNQIAKNILGDRFDSFDPPKFWRGESNATIKRKKIDISVDLSKQGKFEESYAALCEARNEKPNCHKIAFNMGWFALRENKLQEGMNLLARGRFENAFGNPKPPVPTPIWDGKGMGTVLYYLEGGLGDQIHALKFIEDINRRGCDVIVACSASLFPIVKACKGVKHICEHLAAGGIYHDFWIPSMSVLISLGYEYADINGKSYIPRTHIPENKKPVIGVRWQGNIKFEDEQNRRFPTEPFFNAIKGIDADFICLQRDEGEEDCPDFIKKVALNNFNQTREAISSCDLVITSCTSIAHLAAAMGVETWIVVPVLNYYIWAIPGDRTPYYDSVRLFRQEIFGDWTAPMENLKVALETKYIL